MISVLLPSRERAQMAAESIRSLGDGDIEVLLWIDDDDPQFDDYLKLSDIRGTVGHGGPRVGYHGMHLMVNELAKLAKGDWLMLWNDDARIYTPDWQGKLPTPTHRPEVLNIFSSNMEVNLFPLINRAMYETMGHFSLSAHCDSWVQDIANQLEIHTHVPGIEMAHLRDQINDETKQHSAGAYKTTTPLYLSEGMQQLLQEDIKKLKEKL